MIGKNRFQIDVATGRFTLPVVILICLLLWVITSNEWLEGISFLVCASVAYLLVELNTAFTLIRTRTTLHVCFYTYLTTICLFLHPFQLSVFVPLAFLLAIFQLFRSYESPYAPESIFHGFLFTGLGSLAFPQLLYFVPLFYLGMINFRAFSAKSFLAGIIGLTVPYWFLFGYAFYYNKMELFLHPFREVILFQPLIYDRLTLDQLISGAVITLLSLICSVHYFNISYLDKVRTRIFLSFLIITECWIYLLGALQPQHFNVLLQMQIILCSILAGHLFTLVRNKFSGIFFIITFVILIALTIFNLWMRFFNS